MDRQSSFANGSGAGEGSSRRPPRDDPDFARSAYSDVPPEYLVQGNGQISENATSLMASLSRDSGYGGSIRSHSDIGYDSWMEDRPTPARLQADSTTGEYCSEPSILSLRLCTDLSSLSQLDQHRVSSH